MSTTDMSTTDMSTFRALAQGEDLLAVVASESAEIAREGAEQARFREVYSELVRLALKRVNRDTNQAGGWHTATA